MSHLKRVAVPTEYHHYIRHKRTALVLLGLLTALLFLTAVGMGPVRIPLAELIGVLLGRSANARFATIIWNIRLPQATAALVAGVGLAAAGTAMQSILRNPLGSPFTLGIANAGAFGAALTVTFFGTGVMRSTVADAITITSPVLTTLGAFVFCMLTALIIVWIAELRGATPETMVLCGVALSSLFSAGTMFLQYFADDAQLAAIVFWTFGDVARASVRHIVIMAVVTGGGLLYFWFHRWAFNAIDAGDETARGLGIRVQRVRITGMMVAALMTAVIVSFLGVIGFVGLVAPHMVRRLLGDDHRFLLPGSCLAGGALLLASDTVARVLLSPHVLPVAVLTAFLGAPAFLYLLIRGYRR
ncbi:MAG: iron ABC transporter permease [Spirochaetaceae bacterium]|nr:MAG: iron ABC transporter permease [Spirochaetaceae bacterium]